MKKISYPKTLILDVQAFKRAVRDVDRALGRSCLGFHETRQSTGSIWVTVGYHENWSYRNYQKKAYRFTNLPFYDASIGYRVRSGGGYVKTEPVGDGFDGNRRAAIRDMRAWVTNTLESAKLENQKEGE